MIIPIRCMNCGFLLADKWRWYQKKIAEMRQGATAKAIVLDGSALPDTPEKKVMDALGMTRSCCRKHFLTHRDLIDKI